MEARRLAGNVKAYYTIKIPDSSSINASTVKDTLSTRPLTCSDQEPYYAAKQQHRQWLDGEVMTTHISTKCGC